MRGPYISEEYNELYMPVSSISYQAARKEAASWARELLDRFGRSRYTSQRMVHLHDHDGWEECNDCPEELSWCFDLYEGRY